MKKIVKLKGELILFAIIAIILGLITGTNLVNSYRKSNSGKERLRLSAVERNRASVKKIIEDLDNELTQLAEDINYMAQELMEQDLNQKRFIINISYDLRTPLTTMLGYSKMIEEKSYSNEYELERNVSIVNRKGMHLKTLLEDFFDYAKLSSMDIKM
ncbi:histidine kinase dimerization/phospho-acceptor domain-containing protein [Clostridium algidicarnis]|uniref:histidine kinase dimerization/phospho-acceptor domain-containing protein n=1 Tax=Clostridium algidicarnis TaxID=37659 RepID=UPI001C0AC697|nr:histidine kinase dimerization/phospho-acceptor domain-containing protein [Clostridium algidicarnis]MBU3228524.1 hypothetical protein [Clostridium algidicarnis]MBU3251999.1 hypothetical protein [Clostridium algidicarnis]